MEKKKEASTFDMILHIVNKGYVVEFDRSCLLGKVIRIGLRKDDKHHVTLVDISEHSFITLSTDEMVSRALSRALWEFEYFLRKEGYNV